MKQFNRATLLVTIFRAFIFYVVRSLLFFGRTYKPWIKRGITVGFLKPRGKLKGNKLILKTGVKRFIFSHFYLIASAATYQSFIEQRFYTIVAAICILRTVSSVLERDFIPRFVRMTTKQNSFAVLYAIYYTAAGILQKHSSLTQFQKMR